MIALIALLDSQRAIARQGQQIAFIRSDLRRFRALTLGHTVLMGRRTQQTLPKGWLPGRRNMVLSRNPSWHPEVEAGGQVEVCDSVERALSLVAPEETLCVIGGGEVYCAFFALADRLWLTELREVIEGADVWFPGYSGWRLTEASEWTTDPATGLTYRHADYAR